MCRKEIPRKIALNPKKWKKKCNFKIIPKKENFSKNFRNKKFKIFRKNSKISQTFARFSQWTKKNSHKYEIEEAKQQFDKTKKSPFTSENWKKKSKFQKSENREKMRPRPRATQNLQRGADATPRIIWNLVLVRNSQHIEIYVIFPPKFVHT